MNKHPFAGLDAADTLERVSCILAFVHNAGRVFEEDAEMGRSLVLEAAVDAMNEAKAKDGAGDAGQPLPAPPSDDEQRADALTATVDADGVISILRFLAAYQPASDYMDKNNCEGLGLILDVCWLALCRENGIDPRDLAT